MILQRLKQETREAHELLERCLNICNEHLTLAEYKNIVVRFLGFYQPVERLLSAFQQGTILDKEIHRRDKTRLLMQDVNALGIADAALPLCTELPVLDTIYQALGCMYVLEGATLGGQIIARHIQRTLHLNEHYGCAFFYGYGYDTGLMWKAFGELLVEQATDVDKEHVVVAAACETFGLFYQWLLVGASV